MISEKCWEKVVNLTDTVTEESFCSDIYELLSDAAQIAHYTVNIFDVTRLGEPRVSLWGGAITGYWARLATRQATTFSNQKDSIYDATLEQLATGLVQPGSLFRFIPDREHHPEIAELFQESKILEKIYDVRIEGGRIYQLNLYRSLPEGRFTGEEIHNLEQIIPLVMNLIRLHLKICGTEEWQKHTAKHAVSFLRDKGIACFAPLTGQETEVCDLIVYGLTTEGIAAEMGIAVSSVKTYRNRAYKKLKIGAKSELFAMIINSQAT